MKLTFDLHKSYALKVVVAMLFFSLSFLPALAQKQKAPMQPRRLAVSILNLEDKPDYGIGWINKVYLAGCNSVIISIPWERVYFTKDAKANWAFIDKQVKFAADRDMTVALRIHLGRHRTRIDGFWEADHSMTDFRALPAVISYDNSHQSYASKPATERATEFIREVCERYKPYQLAGKIQYISVTSTPDQESGYFYKNRQYPAAEYDALYDFAKPATADMYRQMEEKYRNVNTLNKYWHTSFLRFNQADPYINIYNPYLSFIGKRGKDFYMSRHNQLKAFLKTTGEAIKSVDPGYKVCYEFGSVTDKGSDLRGTYNSTSLSEYADAFKHNDERKEWSFDILAHNISKPIYNEMFPYPSSSVQDFVNLTNWYFENGSSMVAYVVANDEAAETFRQVIEQSRRWYNEPLTPIVAEQKMDLYVSQMIDNYDLVLRRWKDISKNGTVKVAVNLIEDVLEEEKIEFLPYKSPEQLAIEFGYYGHAGGSTGGSTGGGNINQPPPNPKDTTNVVPFSQRKYQPKPIVVKSSFVHWFPNDVFVDVDGYISTIEMVEGPKWLTFRSDGFFFMGTAPAIGQYTVKLRAFDNRNAWVEDTFEFEIVAPFIDFFVIEANYFDVPIREIGGKIEPGQGIFLDEIPEQINIIAKCNVDSISMEMELVGPFYKKSTSQRIPFNIFGEGRGFSPPVGTYQLTARALKGDSLVTKTTISFNVHQNRDLTPVSDWVTYPNPFETVCNVKVPAEIDPANLVYSLVDVSGKVTPIYQDQLTHVDQTTYINFRANQLNQGTFFLRIKESGEEIQTKRIFKR